jgi:hypothetical protein
VNSTGVASRRSQSGHIAEAKRKALQERISCLLNPVVLTIVLLSDLDVVHNKDKCLFTLYLDPLVF